MGKISSILAKDINCIFLILSVIFLIFGNSLTAYFLADDFILIEKARNTDWTKWQSIANSWMLCAKDSSLWWVPQDTVVHFFRPLVSLSFFVNYHLWKMNPFGFHLMNLLAHILSSILVFFIISSIYQDRKISLLSSLLFALHPCQGEAVLWISARCDLICGLFYLVSFFCFLKYRKTDKIAWLAGSLLSFMLALCSKEMAVTLPLVIIFYDLLLTSSQRFTFFKKIRVWLCFLCILFAYLLLRSIILGGLVRLPGIYFYNPIQSGIIFDIFKNLFAYLTGLVLGLSPMIGIPLLGVPLVVLLVIFAAVLLLVFLILRVIKGTPGILFACFWISITLLPVLVILPFERFLYIPSLGFVIIAALFILKLISLERFKKIGIGLLVAVLAGYASFNIIKGAGYKLGSSTLQKIVKDVKKYYPTLPDNSTLYFINLSPTACLSISQCFRLEYDNPTISAQVLTMSPNFGPRCDSYIKIIGEETIVIGLNKGSFFDTPFARFFLIDRPRLNKGETIEWEKFKATVTKINPVGATEIVFKFKDGLNAPNSYFFEFKDWHVYPILKVGGL